MPSRAAIGVLGDHSSEITKLLAQISDFADLSSVTDFEYESVLGRESSARQLWDLLRQTGSTRWGIGPTIASKIMARKRPHLIPIEDSMGNRVTGLGRQNSWQLWWEALRADSVLNARAGEVREHIERPELSTLRTLGIVLWR